MSKHSLRETVRTIGNLSSWVIATITVTAILVNPDFAETLGGKVGLGIALLKAGTHSMIAMGKALEGIQSLGELWFWFGTLAVVGGGFLRILTGWSLFQWVAIGGVPFLVLGLVLIIWRRQERE